MTPSTVLWFLNTIVSVIKWKQHKRMITVTVLVTKTLVSPLNRNQCWLVVRDGETLVFCVEANLSTFVALPDKIYVTIHTISMDATQKNNSHDCKKKVQR